MRIALLYSQKFPGPLRLNSLVGQLTWPRCVSKVDQEGRGKLQEYVALTEADRIKPYKREIERTTRGFLNSTRFERLVVDGEAKEIVNLFYVIRIENRSRALICCLTVLRPLRQARNTTLGQSDDQIGWSSDQCYLHIRTRSTSAIEGFKPVREYRD